MNPLLTQKIEWGVRLKMTGLWARENSQYPGKEVDGGGSRKKETDALTHSHPRLAHAVALPRSLVT